MVWIADLNRDALMAATRDDLQLTLLYRPQALAQVREMVRREQACCAFLVFEVDANIDNVRLTIRAPEEAREAAVMLFDPFQSKSPDAETCGCPQGAFRDCSAIVELGSTNATSSGGNVVAGTAALTATAALACGICCVLPVAMPAIAMTSVGGVLAWFSNAHSGFTVLAMLIVVAGWGWLWRQMRGHRARPSRTTLLTMLSATLALLLALAWPTFEPLVLQHLGRPAPAADSVIAVPSS
jgi:hypothetical protein